MNFDLIPLIFARKTIKKFPQSSDDVVGKLHRAGVKSLLIVLKRKLALHLLLLVKPNK